MSESDKHLQPEEVGRVCVGGRLWRLEHQLRDGWAHERSQQEKSQREVVVWMKWLEFLFRFRVGEAVRDAAVGQQVATGAASVAGEYVGGVGHAWSTGVGAGALKELAEMEQRVCGSGAQDADATSKRAGRRGRPAGAGEPWRPVVDGRRFWGGAEGVADAEDDA